MAITAFQTNTETGLAGAGADLEAYGATLTPVVDFDGGTDMNENAQILIWTYMLVKAIRVRQRNAVVNSEQLVAAGTKTVSQADRIYKTVGENTHFAFMHLCAMIQPVYNEFYKWFNSVDDQADDPWGTNLVTNGTGPVLGPIHGFGSGG